MIVIGDVHGNLKTLKALIAQFPKDQKIVFVGDLIDRGPSSRQVVEYVIENGHDCVMGNHENMMVEWQGDGKYTSVWLRNGGDKCLDSYMDEKGDLDSKVFFAHREWMANLPIMLAYPDVKNQDGRFLVVSHSSCGGVWHWSEEKKEEQAQHFENYVMWGRSPPKDAPAIYNVFGHTPQEDGVRIKVPFANVDTGCFYTWAPKGYGVLSALQFPEMIVYSQINLDVP